MEVKKFKNFYNILDIVQNEYLNKISFNIYLRIYNIRIC